MRQVVTQGDAATSRALLLSRSATRRVKASVEADTVQSELWCQRGATGGDAKGIKLLPIIRKCDLCGTTPALGSGVQPLPEGALLRRRVPGGALEPADEPHKGRYRRAADGGASSTWTAAQVVVRRGPLVQSM